MAPFSILTHQYGRRPLKMKLPQPEAIGIWTSFQTAENFGKCN
jgi:hypothetical protein